MRLLSRVLMTLMLASWCAPPLGASAQTDPLAGLTGQWRCKVARAHDAERSYFLSGPAKDGSAELYGRDDTTEPDGEPSVAFERIIKKPDRSASIEAIEGNAAAADIASLRFTAGTLTVAYTVDGNTMRRVATNAGTTLDDEHCTRLPPAPVTSSCKDPNVRATTLQAVEPSYPAEAVASRASGLVLVVVFLDDRSRVIWTQVGKSDNHLFDEEAIRSARLSTYRTEVRNCRPVAGRYIFGVEFTYNRR
jgi:Gram-negative bacterial TonB protein C-terminal